VEIAISLASLPASLPRPISPAGTPAPPGPLSRIG
jgi:hypothetical protein